MSCRAVYTAARAVPAAAQTLSSLASLRATRYRSISPRCTALASAVRRASTQRPRVQTSTLPEGKPAEPVPEGSASEAVDPISKETSSEAVEPGSKDAVSGAAEPGSTDASNEAVEPGTKEVPSEVVDGTPRYQHKIKAQQSQTARFEEHVDEKLEIEPLEEEELDEILEEEDPEPARGPFRVGGTEVFLPRFTITLIRDKLPPQYASFIVPLNINKLDLRDYLYHAYHVTALKISSRVLPARVEEGRPGVTRPQTGHLYRPAPTKKMTVLMSEPFTWPEEPNEEELKTKWNMHTHREAKEHREAMERQNRKKDTFVDVKQRAALRRQAEQLLKGRETWKPPTKLQGNHTLGL